MLDIILDALLDTAKLIPFLFVTYFAMEYLEHKTGEKTEELVKKAGKFGPVIGGALGMLPQCGFSAAASNLYAGRIITLGTLMAIYLSTSDEMLPILISEQAPIKTILLILLAKAATGIVIGIIIDFFIRKHEREDHEHGDHEHGEHEHGEHNHIHEICEHEHCHCEEGILKSAIMHTLQISLFILLIGLVLGFALNFLGEETLAGFILNRPILGPVLAALVGTIPNCAGSVVITQLYLQNVIGIGAAFAGLLTGTGVGILILFKVNHNTKENMRILGLLYGIGVIIGILVEFVFIG